MLQKLYGCTMCTANEFGATPRLFNRNQIIAAQKPQINIFQPTLWLSTFEVELANISDRNLLARLLQKLDECTMYTANGLCATPRLLNGNQIIAAQKPQIDIFEPTLWLSKFEVELANISDRNLLARYCRNQINAPCVPLMDSAQRRDYSTVTKSLQLRNRKLICSNQRFGCRNSRWNQRTYLTVACQCDDVETIWVHHVYR